MKIKFVTDAIVHVEGIPKTLFSTGDIQELNDASADRWLRRGVAKLVPEKKAAKKTSKKSAKK